MRYTYISFKAFSDWCNQRACDGYWSMETAIFCINLVTEIYKIWFSWRREKFWKENYEEYVRENVVNVIEEKISKIKKVGKNE